MSLIPTEQPIEPPVARTADILPFRPRQPPVQAEPREQPVVQPSAGQERLTRALDALNAAMAEQRTAMAAWRQALADLKSSTGSLSDSLQRYRTNLSNLNDGISSLRVQAQAMEAWADAAVARE
jgi:chromosome segregation ATPase